MKSVLMTSSAGMYRAGEYAGFPDHIAEQVVNSGAGQYDTREINRLGEPLVNGIKAVETPPVDKMVKSTATK